jgi:wobble nucleotide-excising tRNase
MIRNIKSLKNFGKFTDLKHTGKNFTHGDNNRNIIYGFNGSGKTTLSNVLSLFSSYTFVDADQKQDLIADATRLDSKSPEIKYTDVTGNTSGYVVGRDEKPIFVFNENFIATHVFDGSNSNLKSFSNISTELGTKETKRLSEDISHAKTELQHLEQKRDLLLKTLRSIHATNSKNFGKSLTDIGKHLTMPSDSQIILPDGGKELTVAGVMAEIDSLAQDYQLSKQQGLLSEDIDTLASTKVSTIEFDQDLFGATLAQEIKNTDSKVIKERIESLKEMFIDSDAKAEVEGWFKFGRELVRRIAESKDCSDKCPTCNQVLPQGIDALLKEYDMYFDATYEDFIQQIDDLIQSIETVRVNILNNSNKLQKLGVISKRYQHVLEDDQVVETVLDSSSIPPKLKVFEDFLNAKKGNVDENIENEQSEEFTSDEVESVFEEYNLKVEEINDMVDVLITSLKSKSLNTNAIEKQMRSKYKDLTILSFNGSTGEVVTYQNILQRISDLEALIRNKNRELAAAVRELKVESKAVGKYLKLLGIDHFTVDISSDSPSGVSIEFLHSNAIRNNFRNTLSTGEKTALAFAYFISKVENELSTQEFAKATFVIDDPISSLDEDRVYKTAYLINEVFGGVRQLFVLSHNFLFLKNYSAFHSGKNNCYLLSGNALADLPEELNDFESPYFYTLRTMYNFCEGSLLYQDCHQFMPNNVRRVLETYFNFKFCLISRASYSIGLSDFIKDYAKKMALPDVSVGDVDKTNVIGKLSQINRICDNFSHGGLHTTVESNYITEDELRSMVRDALDIILYFDSNHTFRQPAAQTI